MLYFYRGCLMKCIFTSPQWFLFFRGRTRHRSECWWLFGQIGGLFNAEDICNFDCQRDTANLGWRRRLPSRKATFDYWGKLIECNLKSEIVFMYLKSFDLQRLDMESSQLIKYATKLLFKTHFQMWNLFN